MNKKMLAMVLGSIVLLVFIAGNSLANGTNNGYEESAPNSGDGIPDCSGHDSPNGPNGDGSSGSGHNLPAPNAGDGISDGSGW